MEQATGNKILIVYKSPSVGRTLVTGPSTKEKYGYRKKDDVFEVYEADMKTRPDIFRPVNQPPRQERVVGRRGDAARAQALQPRAQPIEKKIEGYTPITPIAQPLPPPPKAEGHTVKATAPVDSKLDWPLDKLDWSGTRVNTIHLNTLQANGVTSLRSLDNFTEAQLIAIKGIGDATVRALDEKRKRYS
jgi:hypothetical protein